MTYIPCITGVGKGVRQFRQHVKVCSHRCDRWSSCREYMKYYDNVLTYFCSPDLCSSCFISANCIKIQPVEPQDPAANIDPLTGEEIEPSAPINPLTGKRIVIPINPITGEPVNPLGDF